MAHEQKTDVRDASESPWNEPPMTMEDLLEIFGPRCPEYDPACLGCLAWGTYDQTQKARRTG